VAIDRKQEFALLRHTRTLFVEGTLSGLTDAELLERFVEQRGERGELAFTVLLERHARMVLTVCRRVLNNPHDVQDAFQATFLVLVRNARSIRNRQSAAGWLQSVAYRVACSARSAASRRRFHERRYAEQSERGLECAIHQDADLKGVLDQELSLLPERQRAVLVLCDLEGLTYDQAAQALGWPMGTVKSRLVRGRERLRSRLIRRGVTALLATAGELWSRNSASAKVPSVLLHSTASAAMSAGLSRSAVTAISPSVFKLMEAAMVSMLLTKAKLSLAAIVIASCLVAPTAFLVGPGFSAAAQETRDAKNLPGSKGRTETSQFSRLPLPTSVTTADFGQLVSENEHSDQPSAQALTLAELKDKLARTTTQNEVLSAEVLRLRNVLSFYHDAVRVSSADRAARGVGGKEKPIDAKEPVAAPPQSVTSGAEHGTDPTHQAPRTQTPASQAKSPGSTPSPRHEPFLRSGGLIFAASPSGNKVVAHSPLSQKEQVILLNATRENLLEVSFISFKEVVGLNLKGKRITRTAVYDHRAGAWIPLDLSEPVSGELEAWVQGSGTLIYDAGRHHYTYSTQTGKWDHFDPGTITDTQEEGVIKPVP